MSGPAPIRLSPAECTCFRVRGAARRVTQIYSRHMAPTPQFSWPLLNEAVGTENTATSGYHETITIFYMWAVRKFIESASPNASLVELANALIRGKCAAKSFPFEYYSRALLLSSEARAIWVEPDLKEMK